MSFATTTFYNVLGRTNVIATANRPAGYFSSFSQSVAGNAGANALVLDSTVSATVLAGQKSFQNTFASIPTATNQDLGLAQFISSPLPAQSHNSETWTFNAAIQVSNATASFTWTFRAALYLVNGSGGSVGTIKTTIVSLSNFGTTGRSSTSELTARGTATGAAWTSSDQDYLVLEWGVNMNNTSGGSLAPNITIFAEGITAISVDNTSTTNAASSVVSTSNVSVYPIVGRVGLPTSPLLQPRAPGWTRTELPVSPVLQPRAPGWVRAELPTSPAAQTRAGDVDQVLMRGFDSSLNKTVYWVAGGVDSSGTQYPGDQTKLSDIVVVLLTGAKV